MDSKMLMNATTLSSETWLIVSLQTITRQQFQKVRIKTNSEKYHPTQDLSSIARRRMNKSISSLFKNGLTVRNLHWREAAIKPFLSKGLKTLINAVTQIS